MRICIVRLALVTGATWLLLAACTSMQTTLSGGETVTLNQPLWQEGWSGWTPAEPAFAQGEPRVNRNVLGTAMKVADLEFDEGLGVAGDAVLLYDVGGQATALDLLAGVDDASLNARDAARIRVVVDGRECWSDERVHGQSPARCALTLTDAQQVRIEIVAPTNVYTDLALLRLRGNAGLRAVLMQARSDMQDFVFQPQRALGGVACLRNGSVVYPVQHADYGACIGVSNSALAVVIAPNHGARVISVSAVTSAVSSVADMTVALHPVERVITRPHATTANDTPWQWRLESNGTLRFLSPPDYVHGVRWAKTVYLLRDLPAARITTMIRNCVKHDVSWSIGTTVAGAPGARLLPDETNARAAVSLDAMTTWLCADVPARGYFPYGGRRMLATTNDVAPQLTFFSEITALEPRGHMTHVVYALLAPLGDAGAFSACAPLYTAVTNRTARVGTLPAEPTGRTLKE